jgi:hypothetical protein
VLGIVIRACSIEKNLTHSDRYKFGRILSGMSGAVVVDGAVSGLLILGVAGQGERCVDRQAFSRIMPIRE